MPVEPAKPLHASMILLGFQSSVHCVGRWSDTNCGGDLARRGDTDIERSRFAGCSTPDGLASVLIEAAHPAGEGRTLILAIDQAEELFDTSDQARAEEAKKFLDALLALLATPPAVVECLVILEDVEEGALHWRLVGLDAMLMGSIFGNPTKKSGRVHDSPASIGI
jgi:hypothetical protein